MDFEIGIITKPQGIRGEMRVLPTTDDPSRFELLLGDEVSVRNKAVTAAYKLMSARLQKGIVIIKLEGIATRNDVETLIGGVITIPQEKALPLSEGEYYVRDLPGLRVESEDGEFLGVIGRVLHTVANDVYVIEPSPGPDDGEPFMIPAIKDIVRTVDIAAGKMTVRLMDGLRELKP